MIHYVVREQVKNLAQQERFLETQNFRHHHNCTVYDHSVHVANMSCSLANFLHIHVDTDSMVRGALLHDYFLYDWHTHKGKAFTHGFIHAKAALKNAEQDYDLNKTERDIIVKHMFPMTPIPPKTKEAWIICLTDKICAIEELLNVGKLVTVQCP